MIGQLAIRFAVSADTVDKPWQAVIGVVKAVHRQGKLTQVVDALRSPSGFPCAANCGQEHRDEDADDRDHD